VHAIARGRIGRIELADANLAAGGALVARSSPAMCFSKTLLPEPLGPMMQKISPALMSRLMSLSTVARPNFFVRFLTVTPKVLPWKGEAVKVDEGMVRAALW
jgi:hypothetical protein